MNNVLSISYLADWICNRKADKDKNTDNWSNCCPDCQTISRTNRLRYYLLPQIKRKY